MRKLFLVVVLLCSFLFVGIGMTEPWDKKLSSDSRWHVIWNGAAVLDRETGLVWQVQPNSDLSIWFSAFDYCQTMNIGGRNGWRLPALEEIMTLIDPNGTGGLPVGHPFDFSLLGNLPYKFWTSSSAINDYIPFEGGKVFILQPSFNLAYDPKDSQHFHWCVRGGAGYDVKGRVVK